MKEGTWKVARVLKPYEQVNIFLIKTKSGEISWIKSSDDIYIADTGRVKIRMFHFQTEVRGHQRIILDIVEGYTKNRIREPEPHISAVPLGKIKYGAAYIWNFFFSFIMPVRMLPLKPETQEEIDNEKLRLQLQELYKTVAE